MRERMIWLFLFCALFVRTTAYPINDCPFEWNTDGVLNDLVLLSDKVSCDACLVTEGVCSTYAVHVNKDGPYETKMIVYTDTNEDMFISFRPTQQDPYGSSIHAEKQMVECTFLKDCVGLVHDRFQYAFQSLIMDLDTKGWEDKNVYIVGHSLGGSLQLFMGLHLWHNLNILPKYMIGLAGPFIGDVVFTKSHQEKLKAVMGSAWKQIETVNKNNPDEFDGTVEGYNMDENYPIKIYIDNDVVCAVRIPKLYDSYGMHDLRNYRLFFTGERCTNQMFYA